MIPFSTRFFDRDFRFFDRDFRVMSFRSPWNFPQLVPPPTSQDVYHHLQQYLIFKLTHKMCLRKKEAYQREFTIKLISTCSDPLNTAISRYYIPCGRILGSAASRPAWLSVATRMNATSTQIPFVAFITAPTTVAGSDSEGSMTTSHGSAQRVSMVATAGPQERMECDFKRKQLGRATG